MNYNCIYKITFDKYYYIGCTNNFNRRKWGHKRKCFAENNKEYNYKLYRYIREYTDKDNFYNDIKFEMICSIYKNKNKYEVEDMFIDMNDKCCLNSRNENVDITQYRKQYYENNKEYKTQYNKQHRENNKQYYKQYYENNKEYIKKNQKEYRENNKEYIKKYRTQKVNCLNCNKEMNRTNLSRHMKKYCEKIKK